MSKTLYLNLEDDVAKVAAKLQRERAEDIVLVFPKGSYLFSDRINMRLLKKQLDMLGKNISILTMDERGKAYAEEAGFVIKSMPRSLRSSSLSDIRPRRTESRLTESRSAEPRNVAPRRTETQPTKPQITSPKKTLATLAAAAAAIPVAKKLKKRPVASAATAQTTAAASNAMRINTNANPTPHSGRTVSAKRADELFEPVQKQDNVFMPPNSRNANLPRRRRSYRAWVVGFIALALVIILVLVLVVLPSANITVYAKSETIARDMDIVANIQTQTPQSQTLTIPAVAVNEQRDQSDSFTVNGKKEMGSKAEGRVAIYNLSGQPITLKASTTTLTVGTKSYSFKSDQTGVHALTSAANDNNASVADIIASDGGESFNLPAGTRMEITNQAFGSQPQKLYAKTVTQVVGGSSRFISVITKEDTDNAQKQLIQKMVDNINAGLSDRNVKLVDGAYTINVQSFTTDKPENTETTTFNAELKVTITGLAFDETGLKNLVRTRLLSSLDGNKTLQPLDQDTIIYKISNLDVQNGIMQLSIHYETTDKPTIDPVDIKNKITGKSKQEASDLILANSDIDHVEITVQPAWQSGIPRISGKIHIEVKE